MKIATFRSIDAARVRILDCKGASGSILTITGSTRKKLAALDKTVFSGCCCASDSVVVVNKNRRITVTADMFVLDDEWLGSDETVRRQKTNSAVLSNIGISQAVMDFEVRMGGEIRVEFHLTAALFDSYGNAFLDGDIKLYEGTSESTTDLDGSKAFQVYVPAGVTTNYFVRVNNDDEGGDYVTVALTATNTSA